MPADTPDVDGVDAPDNYLNAQTLIDNTEFGPEAKRPKQRGQANTNLVLDTREYMVELTDGTTEVSLANQAVKNPWTKCDPGQGHRSSEPQLQAGDQSFRVMLNKHASMMKATHCHPEMDSRPRTLGHTA